VNSAHEIIGYPPKHSNDRPMELVWEPPAHDRVSAVEGSSSLFLLVFA
jgi:hypothetical protein